MGNRKILQSEAAAISEPQGAVTSNASAFNDIEKMLNDFINQSALQGKGWDSAKALANVYKTINQSFVMISEQLTEANARVTSSQAQLLDSQIDEAALENQLAQNQTTIQQLAIASALWSYGNTSGQRDPMENYRQNLELSLLNENAEIQRTLDSLNDFDLATKSAYDEVQSKLNQLEPLLAQVSDFSKVYDSKTGLFTTKNIDMKLVKRLNETLKKYNQKNTASEEEIIKFLSKYTNLPHDQIKAIANQLKKNPANAMKEILKNERLVDAFLYKASPGITSMFLKGFTALETLNKVPGKVADKIINSQRFINYAMSHPQIADKMLDFTILLQQKGFGVLAPLKNLADIAGKTTIGATAVKAATKLMEKVKKFGPALKVAGVAANAVQIANNFSDAYFNPQSPAYNNTDKALYGALCMYALESGPLEQGELFAVIGGCIAPAGGEFMGAAIGTITGLINTGSQALGAFDKNDVMNKLYKFYDNAEDYIQKQAEDPNSPYNEWKNIYEYKDPRKAI